MTSADRSLELPEALQHVFKHAYISNSHIEGEQLSQSEERILSELSPFEVLENLKDLLSDLLAFKKEFKASDRSELARQSKLFEGMLQKLESEVRGHIRLEQQLKLHLEAVQSRVEELEKRNKDEEGRGCKSRSGSAEKEERKHVRRTSDHPKSSDQADRRSKATARLEAECLRLKLALEEKSKELEALRREYDKLGKDSTLHREKTKIRDSDSHLRHSPARSPLSERENQRRAGSEIEGLFRRRYEMSPYKGSEGGKGNGGEGKRKQHWRRGSDKEWRPVITGFKSRPTSSIRD